MTDETTNDRVAEVRAGLARVTARIDRAREAAGRTDEVALVVVTKTFPASDVEILAGLGVTDVAENRDQEAKAKRLATEASAPGVRWHMIGQLQRNKAASVARWADVVESVDRLELVAALGRAAAAHDRDRGRPAAGLPRPGRDARSRGSRPGGRAAPRRRGRRQPALALRGVMGVAPFPGGDAPDEGPEAAFTRLQEVSAVLRERWPEADRISAGMSGDLERRRPRGDTGAHRGRGTRSAHLRAVTSIH